MHDFRYANINKQMIYLADPLAAVAILLTCYSILKFDIPRGLTFEDHLTELLFDLDSKKLKDMQLELELIIKNYNDSVSCKFQDAALVTNVPKLAMEEVHSAIVLIGSYK